MYSVNNSNTRHRQNQSRRLSHSDSHGHKAFQHDHHATGVSVGKNVTVHRGVAYTEREATEAKYTPYYAVECARIALSMNRNARSLKVCTDAARRAKPNMTLIELNDVVANIIDDTLRYGIQL